MEEPQRFGKYRVERRLGAGAFATVWLANDDDLDDAVAIKVLSDNWAVNPEVRRRFVDEAKFLRQLDYDGVVRVHAIDELNDGRPYFVMTYADRGTLQDRLRAKLAANTTFALREALGYAIEMVECLEVVHDFGIVHRDIKPSNVLFRSLKRHQRAGRLRDDRLMLGDFGLAKDIVAASGFTLAAGTPAYMAPEQARASADLDHRADIFSAVAVLYELVAGRAPFSASRLSGVGDSVARAPTPLRSLRDGVPPELDAIIHRGLQPDREERYPTAEALNAALRDAFAKVGDDDMPVPAERSGLGSTLVTGLSEQPEPPTPISMTIALIESIVERYGPMPLTTAVQARVNDAPRLVIAAGDRTAAAAAASALRALDVAPTLVIDATHPDSGSFLARSDMIVVVPGGAVVDAVQQAVRTSYSGPVAVAALVVDAEPASRTPFAVVATVDAAASVAALARAVVADNAVFVKVSAALCELEHELTNDPSPLHAEVWRAIADRVDSMRLAHPELVEFDVLRADARGALRLPEAMRDELRRLVLGSSPVSRLGLEGDAPLSAARDEAEKLLLKWRSYLGSGRAPFAARGAVGTIARSLERLWIELTDG